MGIEPTRPAWKAGILPLNYTRIFATAIIIAYASHFVNKKEENLCRFFRNNLA